MKPGSDCCEWSKCNTAEVFFQSQTGVVLVVRETSGVWISADHESSSGLKGRPLTFLQINYRALIKKKQKATAVWFLPLFFCWIKVVTFDPPPSRVMFIYKGLPVINGRVRKCSYLHSQLFMGHSLIKAVLEGNMIGRCDWCCETAPLCRR